MKTALFISPHLDDAAFSCGGTLIKLAADDWQTVLCTVFTASVPNPTGFALACQTDKGLSAEIDYMKLRRVEDLEFARLAEAAKVIHLDFAEAPHRGYDSASELFAGIKGGDDIWQNVSAKLSEVIKDCQPDLIFAPQGIGNHVDHLQIIKAVLASNFGGQTLWYQDTPYIIRHPNSPPSKLLNGNFQRQNVDISDSLKQKIAACCAYQTQIGFQFGGAENLAQTLRSFHHDSHESFSLKLNYQPREI